MNFIYPGFLFALIAVGIPVIIHLFRFRRFRTVFFPNITFLRQLSEVSDKESRLKHLLVLMARILAIIFLVMAFSRPYIPVAEGTISPEGNAVGVYIDNSFSMNALSGRGRLLDEARSRALEIARMYGPADRFLLLTNDFEGRHQRFVSREEFMVMAQEVEQSARVRTVDEVMRRKQELFLDEPFENRRAYYISDFQKSTSGLEGLDFEPDPPAYLIPLQARQTDNVFIDSVWFDSPVILEGQPITMGVRVQNDGSQTLENQPLRLYVEGQQRTVVSYDAGAGEGAVVELKWPAGTKPLQQAYVEITDYPVTFDDRLYFTYHVSSEIPVLTIEGEGRNAYLHALFGRDELFDYHTMPAFSVDYSALPDFNLIVMDAFDRISAGLSMELRRFVEQGGSLAVFPGRDADLDSYNDFLRVFGTDPFVRRDTTSMRVSSLNEMHVLFDGVFEHIPENIDFPRVNQYYALSRAIGSMGEDLLQLQNGLPFFSSYPAGDGKVFLSAVPLDEDFSNFQRHSVFVPVMVNMALQSGFMQPLYHVIGDDQPVFTTRGSGQADKVYSLRREAFEVIPEQRRTGGRVQLFIHDQVEEAQNYALYFEDERTGGLSLNYDRRESLLEAYGKDALDDMLADRQVKTINVVAAGGKPLDQVLHELGMGRQLWRLFLIMALAFLLAEIFMLRFWK